MNTSQLDFYFPFFVFFYGISLLFMMNVPAFSTIRERILRSTERRTARAFQQVSTRAQNSPTWTIRLPSSNFSEFSLWAMTIMSGLWSLQNLLFA